MDDIILLHGVIGHLSIRYHTDIVVLLSMPIEALYFYFSLIKRGLENER